MPHSSTKARPELPSARDADDREGAESLVTRARRRIDHRYYDRPEVRQTLATLILHRLTRRVPGTVRTKPESA